MEATITLAYNTSIEHLYRTPAYNTCTEQPVHQLHTIGALEHYPCYESGINDSQFLRLKV